ncbi:MAG: BACON domain-containing protein, partial [Acidobacteria bacterium]|nr:BACON domain-containing protein [Acidobacteriota bacterium]
WTATSNAAWITITSGTSGTGNGTVNYSVATNTGAIRSGTMTIAGQTFTVMQSASSTTGLQFYPLPKPIRLLDTRAGQPGCDSPGAPIAGGTDRTQLARRTCDGVTIPVSAMAITGNITPISSASGYLTLYPSNATRPLVANSNYVPNVIVNNVYTVGLGTDGSFKIYSSATTDVVIDVSGYFAPPGAGGLYFHPLPQPIRLLETRSGQTGCYTPGAPITAGTSYTQPGRVSCNGITVSNTAQALVGNATVVFPATGGYITLYPSTATQPAVSSGNYAGADIVNTPFTVGLGTDGAFKIYTSATTDMIVDVLGYYSPDTADVNGAGYFFYSLGAPVRLLDSRVGEPACYTPGAAFTGGVEYSQQTGGSCGGQTIPANASAVLGNVTTVNPIGGYLTLWPSNVARPLVATSNYVTDEISNRHFIAGLGPVGAFKIYASGTTHLVIDLSGYFAP